MTNALPTTICPYSELNSHMVSTPHGHCKTCGVWEPVKYVDGNWQQRRPDNEELGDLQRTAQQIHNAKRQAEFDRMALVPKEDY